MRACAHTVSRRARHARGGGAARGARHGARRQAVRTRSSHVPHTMALARGSGSQRAAASLPMSYCHEARTALAMRTRALVDRPLDVRLACAWALVLSALRRNRRGNRTRASPRVARLCTRRTSSQRVARRRARLHASHAGRARTARRTTCLDLRARTWQATRLHAAEPEARRGEAAASQLPCRRLCLCRRTSTAL